MKKRLLTLFAACSMITTVAAGMVQTAYAEDPGVTIVVSDVAGSDTQKVLTFYYGEDVDGMIAIEGNLSFAGGDVTINDIELTIENKVSSINKDIGLIGFAEEDWEGKTTSDRSFATATITVPGDVDITATYTIVTYTVYSEADDDWVDYPTTGVASVTIPKKSASEPEEPEKTYYNKGYVFTTPADIVAKKYTTLTINVIDTADENKPGYAEVDLTDKLPTISGSGEFTLFIKNIPTAYKVTSVELD